MKINIHFNINGDLLKLCERINQDISHVTGFVHFGAKSIAIPHISIFMGYLNSFEQIELIFEEISNYSNKTSAFRIDPTQLYIKAIKKSAPKFLFLDLLQNQEILKHKKHLCGLFKDQLKPLEWNFSLEPPHITLGCYKGLTNTAIKIIDKYHNFPYCQIEEIGISISGEKGIYLENLKSFRLAKFK